MGRGTDLRGTGDRSISVVGNQLQGPVANGGVGTHNVLLAHALADAGWRVHVLACWHLDDQEALVALARSFDAAGIGFSAVEGLDVSMRFDEPVFLAWSDAIRRSVEKLHRKHPFDLIEFAEWWAAGFATVHARLSRSVLTDGRIVVRLHGPGTAERSASWSWRPDVIRQSFRRLRAFPTLQRSQVPARGVTRRHGRRLRPQ